MIRVIDPNTEEFTELWTHAEPQLTRLMNRYPDSLDWTPEFLESLFDAGEAGFLSCDDGFYIIRDNAEHLDVWIAASYTGECDILETKLPALLALAKEAGYKALTFTSPRRGWQRIAKTLNLDVLTTTYIYRGQDEDIGTENSGIVTGTEPSPAG